MKKYKKKNLYKFREMDTFLLTPLMNFLFNVKEKEINKHTHTR